VRFIGEYLVDSVTGQTMELRPLQPERPLPQINGPLVIFEVPPVDTHMAFEHLKVGDKPDEAAFKALLPSVPPEVVNQYLRDGQQADANESGDNIWRRARFTKEYTSEAAEKAEPVPVAPPAAPPDMAVEPGAEPGEMAGRPKLQFVPGDEAIFPPYVAEDLVTKQVAEYVQSRPDEGVFSHVYRRPLHDYPFAFREIRAELLETNLKAAEVDRQIAAIQKSIELAKDSERQRQDEAKRLAQDLEKFTFEAQTIKKFHDALVGSVKQANDEIAALKQSIDAQSQELAKLQLEAADAINRRTGLTSASAR
jgi:hypothetical protein